ncbi:MAG: hypothetical protein FJY85_06485 [Deltaproteobacteria bacterium]|nr:hypothetical protein [Deltaproteobacteria bacterium]
MQNIFEQPMKIAEQAWEQWRKMASESHQWPMGGEKYFRNQLSQWFATVSSAYTSNVDAWTNLMAQNEEILRKLYKESPFYNEGVEGRIKEACDSIAKAQKTYQEIVKDSLAKIEGLLKE